MLREKNTFLIHPPDVATLAVFFKYITMWKHLISLDKALQMLHRNTLFLSWYLF